MKVFTWNQLALLLILFYHLVSALPRHNSCGSEQRYENQAMCAGMQFGSVVPYPDNCNLYLVCDCLYPSVVMCPVSLWFNNATQSCTFPQEMKCIHYTFNITESSTEMEIETTTTTIPLETSDLPTQSTSSWDPPPPPPGMSEDTCRNYDDGFLLRYPYDCKAFINCTYGWPVFQYCQGDKVFNAILKICDSPETECQELSLPSTSTTETVSPSGTTPLEDEECGPDGVKRDNCESEEYPYYPEYP